MRHTLLDVVQAARVMRGGGVIACPTEAVYGLSCDPRDEAAVRRILGLKQRDEAQGLILVGSGFAQFRDWVAEADATPALATWPGPVTWLFPKSAQVPRFIAGRHATLAIRVSAHPVCRSLAEAFGGPVVSTSANPHGQAPARSAGEVDAYFGDSIDGILAGELGGRADCSQIRDLASGAVLRNG